MSTTLASQLQHKQHLNHSKLEVKKRCKNYDKLKTGLVDTEIFINLLKEYELPFTNIPYDKKQIHYKDFLKTIQCGVDPFETLQPSRVRNQPQHSTRLEPSKTLEQLPVIPAEKFNWIAEGGPALKNTKTLGKRQYSTVIHSK